jgi:LSD1 subclass zinc finger protein
MASTLLVSTECPTCGAPLDFMEGSNTVQCAHCKSNLLVTGRKQILSYFVRPKLDIHRGVARTMIAHKENGSPCRVVTPQLYFIPYYRLMGQDFRWETRPGAAQVDSLTEPEMPILNSVETWSDLIFGTKPSLLNKTEPTIEQILSHDKNHSKEGHEVLFQEQYVEKNFIASQCKELGLYSLGVRPSVLKLELFGKSSLDALGKVVKPDISPEEAFARGMKSAGGESLLYRQVLGRILSIIYFPFWVMEVEVEGVRRLTVLDAISESVIQLKAPLLQLESLSHPLTEEPSVIRFRPLVCPNCAWDLNVQREDVIFFCKSCKKPWQILADALVEIGCQVIVPIKPMQETEVKYLPFWIIEANSAHTGITRYFLPGFRYRRLKILSDLATSLTKMNPPFTVTDPQGIDSAGCYYDQEDAINMAKVAEAGLIIKSQNGYLVDQNIQIESHRILLTWIPYYIKGESLIDPFTGITLTRTLLG